MNAAVRFLKQRGMPWLIGSILAYAGFVMMPFGGDARSGLDVWADVFRIIITGNVVMESSFQLMTILAFFSCALLVLGGPFLTFIMKGSVHFHWVCIAFSALTLIGFGWLAYMVIYAFSSFEAIGLGFYALVLSQLLNLVGFLRVKTMDYPGV